MDLNEWLAAQWTYWRRKIDQLAIAGLVILLAVVACLWWLEQQVPGLPPVPNPPPPSEFTPGEWTWTKTLFTHEKDFRNVQKFAENVPNNLLGYNMFDSRGARPSPQTQAQIDAKYTAAQAALAKGDIAEATRLCAEILSQSPSHQGATELMKTINK